jgi:hypothetical protein
VTKVATVTHMAAGAASLSNLIIATSCPIQLRSEDGSEV